MDDASKSSYGAFILGRSLSNRASPQRGSMALGREKSTELCPQTRSSRTRQRGRSSFYCFRSGGLASTRWPHSAPRGASGCFLKCPGRCVPPRWTCPLRPGPATGGRHCEKGLPGTPSLSLRLSCLGTPAFPAAASGEASVERPPGNGWLSTGRAVRCHPGVACLAGLAADERLLPPIP